MSNETNSNSNSAIKILFLAVFIDLLGFGLIIPLMPIWVKSSLHQNEFTYGLLVSSYSLMQFIFAPIWGKMSDQRGRRPIIMVGLFGTVIGFSLLTVAFTLVQTIEMLFLARIIGGIFTSATLPTSQAFIADSTIGKDRAKGFGLLGAAFGLGFSLGPGMGGLLALINVSAPAIFATLLAIVNLTWASKKLPESLTEEVRAKRKTQREQQKQTERLVTTLFHTKPTLPVIISMFSILTVAFVGMETTLILLGNKRFGLDQTTGGLVLLVVGIVAIITQGGLIKPLTAKFPDLYLGLTGLVFLIIGFLGLSTAQSLPQMVLWVIPLAFGSSLGNPTLASLLSKQAPPEKSGEILGLNQGMNSLMRIIGPLEATLLFEINDTFPYYLGSALLLVSLFLGLFLSQMLKKQERTINNVLCSNCGIQLTFGSQNCQRCGFTK